MFLPNAHSAEMVNVEYIHQYLNARWGIDLPYNPELKNPRVAANMKYLLTVVDIANEYLNGDKTTDYGNSEYATLAAADTVATNTAIDTLVKAPPFTITTTPNTSSFGMIIGAAGNFTIDWGDGQSEVITDKPIGTTRYSHTYTTSGEYEIKLTGLATDYSDAKVDIDTGANWVPAFALNDAISGAFRATNVAKISGGLGRVFPTMDDGSNPNFAFAFAYAPITEIPADLFDGISGAPTHAMFFSTFAYTAITSIPADLFGTLNGDGAPSMFAQTFSECPNLTTIDGPLFSGTLTPAEGMFGSTFSSTALTEIPADLFAGIRGAPAESMFSWTFSDTAITEIPADLFAGIQGAPAESMFDHTFAGTAITEIPANLFAGIRGAPASSMFSSTFVATPITSIPENLFAGIQGAPAENMFYSTFQNAAITSIPDGLFAGIQGAPAESMFVYTFSSTDITSIPENLFAGISGPAANKMFYGTFRDCRSLTGPSARINGQYLYEIWPDVSRMYTYSGATGLSDYDQIPSNWK